VEGGHDGLLDLTVVFQGGRIRLSSLPFHPSLKRNDTMQYADKLSPNKWDHYYGNSDIKRYFAKMNVDYRAGNFNRLANAIITGRWRQGKTCGARLGINSLHCVRPDSNWNPCGTCYPCQSRVGRNGAFGQDLFFQTDASTESSRVGPISTYIVNGKDLDLKAAQQLTQTIREEWAPLSFVSLDEACRIPRHGLEHLLSKMDQLPAIWIATSTIQDRATTQNTDAADKEAVTAFWKRFPIRLKTQLPDRAEFAKYIAHIVGLLEVELVGDSVVDLIFKNTGGEFGDSASYVQSAAMTNDGRLTEAFVRKLARREQFA
jgi:hypothetical protein